MTPQSPEAVKGQYDLTTLAGQQRHYASVRARLAAKPHRAPRGLPMVFMVQPKPLPVLPIEPVEAVPLNMLAPCSWRFLVAVAALRGGVEVSDIMGRRKQPVFVRARYDAMALTYEHTQNSFPQVGWLFGRDHSTVIYGMHALGRSKKLVDRFICHPGGNPKARTRRGERLLKSKLNWEVRT